MIWLSSIHLGESLRRFGFCNPESQVQQQFKNECDINYIVKRFLQTGQFVNMRRPEEYSFGDFTGLDYRTALDFVRSANEQFNTLDSHIRERFANNPYNLLQFLENPANREEAERLGLIVSRHSGLLDPTVPTDTEKIESEV